MKNIIKNQKGAITLFVLVSMLFMTMLLATTYTMSTNNEIATRKATQKLKEIYEVGLDRIDDIYIELSGNIKYAELTYLYDSSNYTATVTGVVEGEKLEGAYAIPSEVVNPDDGQAYAVTSIGGMAFYECTSLTSITIPKEVTSIEGDAFRWCTSLTSVTFDKNTQLSSIEEGTFYGCSSLTEIEIPSSVTSIGNFAFCCSSLTSVAFAENSQLTSIGDWAFNGCSMTEIEIPSSVINIGEEAFSYCENLTSVAFAENSQLTSIGKRAFEGCSSLTEIEIPSNVTSIGFEAFLGCSMTEIEIPSSVTSIGGTAFSDCYSLTEIKVEESNENYSSKDGVLFNESQTEIIKYPEGKSDTTYTIPSGVIYIQDDALYNCSSLTEVEIPSSVTSIGYGAFARCRNLTSVRILSREVDFLDYTNVFEGCSEELTIYGYAGSTAENYANENGINFATISN